MKNKSRFLVGSLFATMVVASVAAVAWACTAQTVITELRPASGPAGTNLLIAGRTDGTPLAIHWNSAEGPTVAAAPGGQFSVAAAIPADAKPGFYFLMANGRALQTFEVTGPGQSQAPQRAVGDLWSGFGANPANSLEAAAAPGRSTSQPMRMVGATLLGIGLVTSLAALTIFATAKSRKKGSAKSPISPS